MEKVRMNLEIGGHEYTKEKMSKTREFYHFNGKILKVKE